MPLRQLVLMVTLATLATPSLAHSPERGRLGASAHGTPPGSPESWATYCVTELAPLFRAAIALNEAKLPPSQTPVALLASASGTTGVLVANAAAASQPSAPPAAAPAATPVVPATGQRLPQPVGTPLAVAPGTIPLLPRLPMGAAATPAESPEPIQVFVARKVVTMDPGWPEGTAVAVKSGRIVSVGTLEDFKPWLDRYPHVIDRQFADRVIYPGFIEAHGHPVLGSVAISRPPLTYFPLSNPWGPDFPGVKTLDEAVAAVKKYVAEAATPDTPILTWGYDGVAMGGVFPDRAQLDKVAPTNPLIIWDASEHFAFANSAALTRYGITDALVAKTIGAGRNPDGTSNGQFLGTEAARILLPQALSEYLTPEAGLRSLQYLGALMQQAGITTTGDLFYGGVNLTLENLLTERYFGAEDSMVRIVHVADGATFAETYGDQALAEAIRLREHGNDRRIFNGVKFYADDAFLSLGMQLEWPGYVNPQTYKGLFMYANTDAFVDAMRPWWNAGFQIHVHSNGSGGNQITLDALAALQAERPRFDHRFSFEHFGISTTAQGRQLKALGAVVSTNPYYVYERADLTAAQIGTDRAALASRMASLIDQDVVVALHSDTPVGVPSPLLEVWVAVQRLGLLSGKVQAPAERVTDVYRAMRMVTVDAAYVLGVDDRLGSIETGKYADFVVLSDDPQTVDPMKIRDIEVIATILGGRVGLTAATRTPPPPISLH